MRKMSPTAESVVAKYGDALKRRSDEIIGLMDKLATADQNNATLGRVVNTLADYVVSPKKAVRGEDGKIEYLAAVNPAEEIAQLRRELEEVRAIEDYNRKIFEQVAQYILEAANV
jgi:hypothetical protein